MLLARSGQHGQGTASVGRGLYVERLTAGSTAAARKCLLITCKIIIPPLTAGTHRTGHRISRKKRFPPDCWDPPATPSHARKCVWAKKNDSPPDYWDPPGTSSHARKCVRAKKMICPPDCWDPPTTSSHARKCLTVRTHLVEVYVALSLWSRTCTYIYTGGCRGAHVS